MINNTFLSQWVLLPIEKEKLTIQKFRPYFLNPEISETEIIKNIKLISNNFTVNRKNIQQYVLSEDLISSYVAFYFTTNVPKLYFLLSKLKKNILFDLKNREVIDFGMGPGTFSYAFSCLLESKTIVGIDNSILMQNQAKKIMNGLHPDVFFQTKSEYNFENRESILFFGHSINEMGIKKTHEVIKKINPMYLIWIEPGTSQLFLELKQLREQLVTEYEIIYPCPSTSKCQNEWCHQVMENINSDEVERLSQLVKLDRKVQPLFAMLFKRKEVVEALINKNENLEETVGIITRFINETKFSFEFEICSFLNEENQIYKVEIMKKKFTKSEVDAIRKLEVGASINFKIEKKLVDKNRIQLINF